MAFDLEFGCKSLVSLIVSRRTAEALSKADFNKLEEAQKLEYINQLVDLGWVREQRPASGGGDYVIYAFTDKGRRIYENPVELLSQTDAEQEHISLLRKLDSLKSEDSVAMMPQVLLSLANACLGVGRYDSALMYSIELQKKADEIKSTYFKAEAELMVGRVDNARGEMASSLKSFMEGAALFRKIGEIAREADCLRSAGGVLFKMGDYKKAMVMFEESKNKFMQIRHMLGVAKSKSNLAILYSIAKDYDTAEKYWKYSLDFFQALGDRESEGKILNNLGAMLIEAGKLEDASSYLRQGILSSRAAKDKYTECMAVINFAYAQAKLGFFELSHNAIESIAAVLKEGYDTYLLAFSELVMAMYHSHRGIWAEAEKRFLSAIRLANNSGNTVVIAACHAEYGRVLMERNQQEKALVEIEMSKELTNKLHQSDIKRGLASG